MESKTWRPVEIRYHFNLLDEQVEDLDNTRVEGGKRKLYLQPPTLLVDDTDETTTPPTLTPTTLAD
nr:unnamed protein product [Callosobruchus analis]